MIIHQIVMVLIGWVLGILCRVYIIDPWLDRRR